MTSPLQLTCETALRYQLGKIGETFTVTGSSEHRITDDTATRLILWMERDADGSEFRADCVEIDGQDRMDMWLFNEDAQQGVWGGLGWR